MSLKMKRKNIMQLLREREINDHIRTKYALKSQISSKCITKLGLLTELEGHRGCVNCLEWNDCGSVLASASDDFQVILWDPFLQRKRISIKTLHRGNIFTVKFLPNCHDDIVATGAGDWCSHTYNVTTGKQLSACTCARSRVKRITVANDTPNVYWSASEDGTIRQHDMRISHQCSSEQTKNVLVFLRTHLGTMAEAKCLAINQMRTEQLAVGANDPYVRLYDRRMIRSLTSVKMAPTGPPINQSVDLPLAIFRIVDTVEDNIFARTNNISENSVQYFIPGHIYLTDLEAHHKYQNIGTTYLNFSPNGRELLVNLGGEHIYLFNLIDQVESTFCVIPKVVNKTRENGEGSSIDIPNEPTPVLQTILPIKVEKLKLEANYLFDQKEYTTAIRLYNQAIDMFECSVLYSNRAAAYIKRKWEGDLYAALRDCVTALKLDPNHMKAFFRMTVCLFELGKLKESKIYLEQFKLKFPSYKSSPAYKSLSADIISADEKCKNVPQLSSSDTNETFNNEENELPNDFEQNQKSKLEEHWRKHAKDYHHRYYGHCNTSTDIKEANFFGSQGQYIVAGSDDGLFFVWDKNTENNILVLKGDSSIVNCLQAHPSEFMLATSGIDNVVKLWTPLPDDIKNENEIKNFTSTALQNQRRMMTDPFEVVLRNMGMGLRDTRERRENESEDRPEQFYTCRPS